MKLADALVLALRAWDVRYVFGVSGANIEHLHDAILRGGGGELTSVLAKSEVGAAFMADARARTHRTLGVCCATSGGGMMNLTVGVAESFSESVPVLAIVGQVPRALEGKGGFQDSSGRGRTVDALAMWRAMTKYAARLDRAGAFWQTLEEAARAALSGRPGPAVLLVPRDAYDLEVGAPPASFPWTQDALAAPPPFDPKSVAPLFEAMRRARKPVLLLGSGARRSKDHAAIVRLARDACLPVATTMADPGAFPNDDDLWLGVAGAAGHPSTHAYINDQADWIFAVGTGLSAMVRNPIARGLARAKVAVVNLDCEELPSVVTPAVVVEGDAGEVFCELLARHASRPFSFGPADVALTRYRAELVEPERAMEPGLLQSEAIAILERSLPELGHVLFDAGNCAAAAVHGVRIPEGVTSTIALGMGGMGYAIAGAVGSMLGAEDGARAVVVCGDGAFLMTGFEIHTAVELGLPILFVVFNNGKHGMCVTRQKLYFDGRVDAAEYAPVDVATVARGMAPESRLWVARATTAGEVWSALRAYGLTRGPGCSSSSCGAKRCRPSPRSYRKTRRRRSYARRRAWRGSRRREVARSGDRPPPNRPAGARVIPRP